jgi:hypothetical protein
MEKQYLKRKLFWVEGKKCRTMYLKFTWCQVVPNSLLLTFNPSNTLTFIHSKLCTFPENTEWTATHEPLWDTWALANMKICLLLCCPRSSYLK